MDHDIALLLARAATSPPPTTGPTRPDDPETVAALLLVHDRVTWPTLDLQNRTEDAIRMFRQAMGISCDDVICAYNRLSRGALATDHTESDPARNAETARQARELGGRLGQGRLASFRAALRGRN